LEELDNEGDTVGRVFQMLNNGADFLLSITHENIPAEIAAIVVPIPGQARSGSTWSIAYGTSKTEPD
jgi:hypothetical protein